MSQRQHARMIRGGRQLNQQYVNVYEEDWTKREKVLECHICHQCLLSYEELALHRWKLHELKTKLGSTTYGG